MKGFYRGLAKVFQIMCVVYTNNVFAADPAEGLKLGLGAQLLIPLGTFSENFNSGVGASAHLKYMIGGRLGIGALAGYNILRPRIPVIGAVNSLRQIGISADYFFEYGGEGAYATIDVSRYFLRASMAQTIGGMPVAGSTAFGGVTGIAPGIGYVMQAKETMAYFGVLRYHWIQSVYANNPAFQMVSIQVGLLFGF